MYSVLFLIVYLANAVRSTENVTFETRTIIIYIKPELVRGVNIQLPGVARVKHYEFCDNNTGNSECHKYFNWTECTDRGANTPETEYILPCLKADPEINKCLVKTFNHLRPYLKEGIKDIDVPSLDPLTIDNLIMENGRGPFRIRAAFYNISTNGASNYSVGNIKTDLDNYVIEFGIHLPRLECKGKYDVNGNVLLFPVRSKGDFWAIFLDVNGAAKIFGKEFRNEKDVRFMKIDKMVVDFEMKKSRFRIKDIINHGNIIGEAMNQFLNNNADEIIAEMKPAANAAIAKHFKGFLNGAFVKLPLKVWLPDA